MYFSIFSFLTLSIYLTTVVSSLRLDSPKFREKRQVSAKGSYGLTRRGEPSTGDDDFPDTEPHPNRLDQVETAFNDAIELTSYVKMAIASDTDIFPHYFNEEDRAEITRIFTAINNNDQGNDLLDNIFVQTEDPDQSCNGGTLAYLRNGETGATEAPVLVLCPNAFNKKAVTPLNGADPGDQQHYTTCDDLGDYVSYQFNTLGMTLLHEYLHYDSMIASSFGSVVDYPNTVVPNIQGYGPVNVYDNLDKSLARTNADSYAYYASHILWNILCQPVPGFQAPRPGIDDADPDCGGTACQG